MEIPSSFIEITEKVGKDINLVQGPGGNISFKKDGYMYIKASGTRMSEAKKKNIFVKTNHKKIISALNNNEPEPLKNCWIQNSLMRPSIETTMHALMPQKYVLHVHCVNTLSWLVQKNYQKKINPFMRGVNWVSVPYKKPGICLSNEIKNITAQSNADVILLSNHGIVAGSDTPEGVLKKISSISKKLYISELKKKEIVLEKFGNYLLSKNYKLPKYDYVHKIAFSKFHYLIATKGNLFPDQIVFLENGIVKINSPEELINLSKTRIKNLPVVLIPNLGILVPRTFNEVNEVTLYGLSMIISRLPQNASINYLNKKDQNELINWDLEKHRKKINI